MESRILIDTSFLYGLYNPKDKNHRAANVFANQTTQPLVMPDVVLVEAAFFFYRAGGVPANLKFFRSLYASGVAFEPVVKDDLLRIEEVMSTYADAKLDVVDCCIMALAERLNITQICTFDRRDFSIFRPKHCDFLELLP